MNKKILQAVLISSSVTLIPGCAVLQGVWGQFFGAIVEAAPSATGNARDVARITNDPAPEFRPSVSPDAKSVLFTVRDTTKFGSQAYSIFAINVNSSGRRPVTNSFAYGPSWLSDNQRYIYSNFKTQSPNLVIQSLQGGGLKFVSPTSFGSSDMHASFSPDGRLIAFQTGFGGKNSICTVEPDGRNFTVYTDGEEPAWHPRGGVLAFSKMLGDQEHIFTLDIRKGEISQLTSGPSRNTTPKWSPDGRWLAFSSNRDGSYHIYALKADASSLVQLTTGSTNDIQPFWSADDAIYFSSDAGGNFLQSGNQAFWTHADIWRLKPQL